MNDDNEEEEVIEEVTITLDVPLCNKLIGRSYDLFNEEGTPTAQAIGAVAFSAAFLMYDRVGPDTEAFEANLEEFSRIMRDIFDQLSRGNFKGVKPN